MLPLTVPGKDDDEEDEDGDTKSESDPNAEYMELVGAGTVSPCILAFRLPESLLPELTRDDAPPRTTLVEVTGDEDPPGTNGAAVMDRRSAFRSSSADEEPTAPGELLKTGEAAATVTEAPQRRQKRALSGSCVAQRLHTTPLGEVDNDDEVGDPLGKNDGANPIEPDAPLFFRP